MVLLLCAQGGASLANYLRRVGNNISLYEVCPLSLSDVEFVCLWELRDREDPYRTLLYLGEDWEQEGYQLILIIDCEVYAYHRTGDGPGFLKFPSWEFYTLDEICQKLNYAGKVYIGSLPSSSSPFYRLGSVGTEGGNERSDPIWAPDTPWDLIYEACSVSWGPSPQTPQGGYSKLGEWEAAFMAAIYRAEGGSFGTGARDLCQDARICANTIKWNVERFWYMLIPKLYGPQFNYDEAVKFGKSLISTIYLESIRLGREVAKITLGDLGLGFKELLGSLVPGYLYWLDMDGSEPLIISSDKRGEYIKFLLQFVPDTWRDIVEEGPTDRHYADLALECIKKFMKMDLDDQFLFFASFVFPYYTLKPEASGYCPIFDLHDGSWGGIYRSRGLKKNTNWGMNVYHILKMYFQNPSLPWSLTNPSYFLVVRNRAGF